MTEAEWNTCFDPERMHQVVAESTFMMSGPNHLRTARKRLLFCVGCCRLVWPLIAVDERCRKWVNRSEELADQRDIGINEEDEELLHHAMTADRHPEVGTSVEQMLAAGLVYDLGDTQSAIGYLLRGLAAWGDQKQRTRDTASLLRCIAGNPFRPVVFDPSWRTETVVSLASAIYAERAFDRMPILADALEESGCDHADILNHCRRLGPHARGCWVADGVLSK